VVQGTNCAAGNVLNIAQIEEGSPCLVEVLCC
jgi:hypothetical protein